MSSPHRWGLSTPTVLNKWDSVENTALSVTDDFAEVAEEFTALAEQWRAETSHLSVMTKRLLHPAYQQIIGLGAPVVPIILRELEARPDYWFHALRSITKADPVKPEQRANLDAMTAAWLAWGRDQGHLD